MLNKVELKYQNIIISLKWNIKKIFVWGLIFQLKYILVTQQQKTEKKNINFSTFYKLKKEKYI